MKKFKELVEGLSHKVPVYHADRKTLVGHVTSGATSIGAAKLAKKKSAIFSRVNGEYSWVASDDLKESRYADAMMSRLPAHLDDPREKETKRVAPSAAYLKSKEKRKQHFANKGDIRVNESTWDSYRDRALSEAAVPLKGHPFHTKTDAELHDIARDASHKFPAHLEQTNELNKHSLAAVKTILAYRHGVKETELNEEAPHRGRVMDFHDRMEHSYHGGAEAKKDRDAYAKHLKDLGHKIKKSSTPNQILHGTWGNVYTVSHPRPVTEERTPNEGEVYVDPFDKHTIHSYHGVGAKEKRDAYAKHLRSIGSTIKSYSHADDHSYHVMRAHLAEETERERATHQDRIGSTLDANHHEMSHTDEADEQIKKGKEKPSVAHVVHHSVPKPLKESTKTYKVGDHVVARFGPHAGQVHRVIHVHSNGHVNIQPVLRPGSTNRYRLGAAKADPRSLEDAPGHGSKNLTEASEKTYEVGDHVVPKIGPHAGQVHRVIHVHPTGHVNITPELRPGSKNRYHLGAARAHPKDLEDAPGHGSKKLEESTLLAGREEKPLQNKTTEVGKSHGWIHNRGNQFHKWPAGVKLHNINPLTSRKTVREAFEAAKKKLQPGDFDKPKDTESNDQKDPGQTQVSAAPPQFGGKNGDAPKQEKKSNAPAPEKKGGKLVVQGVGPDDKFQADPIVTPLTTLPDTASPRSGSQGVR